MLGDEQYVRPIWDRIASSAAFSRIWDTDPMKTDRGSN